MPAVPDFTKPHILRNKEEYESAIAEIERHTATLGEIVAAWFSGR